jgi:hypothetical protein
VRRTFAAIVVAAAVLGAAAAHATSTGPPLERVTVISDSIAASIQYNRTAQQILSNGIDLDLELAPCRRLVGDSCPHDGVRPPTLVDLVPTLHLGPTVAVIIGYNDHEDTFAASVEAALQTLDKAGAKRILWFTIRAERQSYLHMNDVLRDVATRHPEVTVLDWNVYSRSHPDWFQADGLHLLPIGTAALATFLHDSLDQLGLVAPPPPGALVIATKKVPAARVGHRYAARLTAIGGTAPIRWQKTAGSLPDGLHLGRNGSLTGTPLRSGKRHFTLLATDDAGMTAIHLYTLVVRP